MKRQIPRMAAGRGGNVTVTYTGGNDSQTMPSREEHQFLTDTMILRNTLAHHGPAIRDRLKKYGYKYGWRDVRLMISVLTRLQDRLLDTMPPRRQDYYHRLATAGRYKVEMGTVTDRRYVWADAEDLGALTEAAMSTECAMCVREGRELRGCRLRQALLALAPLDKGEDTGRFASCEYRWIASELIKDREVNL